MNLVLLLLVDWAVGAALKVSNILLANPTFEGGLFI